MGILIGDREYRSKGVASEVLDASAAWLKAHRAIDQIVLGVSDRNNAAINAYAKAGFVVGHSDFYGSAPPGVVVMVRRL
jgi:RimJ/RimL family protein N-acetyltransferase